MDEVPSAMRAAKRACGYDEPPLWHNTYTAINLTENATRSLAAFVYDDSVPLDTMLTAPLPSQKSAPLLELVLMNKRGGVLALITTSPFILQGFAPLCQMVPTLLAAPGNTREALMQTPVYQLGKLTPDPLWRVLWGSADTAGQ
jgi:hypothetical protein